MSKIFVFGSNTAGIHGAGAAFYAAKHHGAKLGKGVGRTGSAYALPTKDNAIQTLPLEDIQQHVDDFIEYAIAHPQYDFKVTRIGCGLAGYKDEEIASLFMSAPDNCFFDLKWKDILGLEFKYWGTV